MAQLKQVRKIIGFNKAQNLGEVTITPDMARELIKFNTHNRPRQRGREKEYAADMKEGKFGKQESMIGFGADGVLTNGQTRLYACIEADVPFNTIVNLELEQNLHMDTGKTRNTVDNIQLSGVLDGVITGTSNSIKVPKILLRLAKHATRVRDEEVVAFCEKYATYINNADTMGLLNLSGPQRSVFKSEIASAFLLAYINGVDMDTLTHIRAVLTDGMITSPKDAIIINYRDKVKDIGNTDRNLDRRRLYNGAQHMIWCYANNKNAKRVKLDEEYYTLLLNR